LRYTFYVINTTGEIESDLNLDISFFG